jgi:hypothetical protein
MSDIVIAVYSRTGKTRMVAERLAELIGADLEEIREDRGRAGMTGFLGGAMDALRRRQATLVSTHSTAGRRVVIVGTPVWANRPAPAVRTYLQTVDLTGKTVCALATHDGGGARKTFAAIAELIGAEPAATLDFRKPKGDDPELLRRLEDWAEQVRRLAAEGGGRPPAGGEASGAEPS